MLKVALLTVGRWFGHRPEPTITEMLSDSIVQAVMEADGVNPAALERELRSMARKIYAARFAVSPVRGAAQRNGIAAPRARRVTCPFRSDDT